MTKKILLTFLLFIFSFLPAFSLTGGVKYSEISKFDSAFNKFKSGNVNVAYDEFEEIVQNSPDDNDYINYVLAGKLSGLGLFNLADVALAKIKDKELSKIPVDNIKSFYHQKDEITKIDDIALGDYYSGIVYNNLSREYAFELTVNQILRDKYDYANYLTALAWYNSENYEEANKYIDLALEKNPKNLMYNFLYAKILADLGHREKAIKTVENIRKNLIFTNYYDAKCKEYTEYIYYKTAKTNREKNLHLSLYYYYRGDYLRSIKVSPVINEKNKKEKAQISMLLSSNFVELKEYDKALLNAERAYKIDVSNASTLIILGDLKFIKEDYKGALKYYKDAMKKEKGSYVATVKTAEIYMMQDKGAKAKELLTKVLKNSSDYAEAYYMTAMLEPEKKLQYLKRAVSLNNEYTDGWLELGKYEYDKGNSHLAQIYLNNAYNLDQNNYKYYYYQGLLYKSKNDLENAKACFTKCLKLNPKFKPVKKELK